MLAIRARVGVIIGDRRVGAVSLSGTARLEQISLQLTVSVLVLFPWKILSSQPPLLMYIITF